MLIKYKSQWYKEAIQNLGQYRKDPFLFDFMDMHNIPYTYSQTKNVLLHRIEKRLKLKKAPSLFDLTNYLDELKFYGKQHIFLYKLSENQQQYLENLRNPTYILSQLRKKRLGTRLNNEIFKWDSDKPKLVVAQHSYHNGKGYLKFKWIETRGHFDPLPPGPEGLPRFISRKERSVSFFIINLEDGSAELRIQSVKQRPHEENDIESELNIYKEKISELLYFHLFSPIPLENIIKVFLAKPILTITGWSSLDPAGDKVGKDTFSFKKFWYSSKNNLSKELNASWYVNQKVTGKQRFNFTLNSKHDAILFNSISDKSKVNFTINQLKKLSQPNIENKKLSILSIKYPEYSRIIQNIDYYLTKKDIPYISARQVAKNILYSDKQVKIVFQKIVDEIPKTFYIKANKKNELSISNRYNLKGGLLIYIRRRAYGTKWAKWIELIIAIIGSILSISSIPWVNYLFIKILKLVFGIVLPPYISIVLIILYLILIIILQFGIIPYEAIRRILGIFEATTKRLWTGTNEISIQKSFDREYKKYLKNLPKHSTIDDEIKLIN